MLYSIEPENTRYIVTDEFIGKWKEAGKDYYDKIPEFISRNLCKQCFFSE
jgi:hypothetical protein